MSHVRRRREVGLTALAVASVAAAAIAYVAQDAKPPQQARPPEPVVPLADVPPVAGVKLSADGTYDNQPAVAETADGTSWVAYVRYHNHKADELVVVSRKGGEASKPHVLSPAPGQFIRPALAARGENVWCVWTVSEPERTASIWFSQRIGGRWAPAARILPDEKRAHQNPEIAAAADGRVAVAYQVHAGRAYDIHLSIWSGQAWSAPRALNDPGGDHWDPAIAFDAKGTLHAVWCAFGDGDYDVFWKRGEAAPRRISARGEYDLHPWIAAAPDGTVWASWDVVQIPRHGNSGRTTITGANHKYEEAEGGYRTGTKISSIEVRVLDGETVRIPGKPRDELKPPQGYAIAHTALAKVAVGPGGEPWVIHRVLRRAANSPGIGYYWDLLGRPFRGGKWGEAVRFGSSDGYLEEAGVASSPGGLRVAYGGEHRSEHIPAAGARRPVAAAPPHEDPPGTPPHDHHRDFDARRGWNGEVHFATAGQPGAPGPAAASLPEIAAPADLPVPKRLARRESYRTTSGGKTWQLLWGDTHKHSNVSRCSQGNEPTPDDLYRYGTDVFHYDWFALSDHAEDPRQAGYDQIDYYWWKQQKLADLYHVPGFMSVLYNFEWSLQFPHGHHNTIFPSRPTLRLDRSLAASSTLAGGWKHLEKNKLRAITIPHTGADPGMGTAWEVQDDRYQRLCEIFQACRGSYEHAGCPREFTNTRNKKGFYWNALEKGYHVGVIASTDHGYGVSYACVYAPDNSRESIWQALWDRRTYGSTAYGLVLELRSGDRWMGEEWSSREAPPLEIYVRGSAPVRSVEILGRSKVLHAEGSAEKPLGKDEVRLRWTDPEWAAQDREQWYYVRVIQADDEMAWSSPVWVTPVR